MTRDKLRQYSDLLGEAEEVRDKIDRLEMQISKIEDRLEVIKSGEVVKDKVYGGLGGVQGFVITGFPTKEYEEKRSSLLTKRLLLNQQKSELEILEFTIMKNTNDIVNFMSSINDSYIRRIVNLRYVENLTWDMVAARIGGGNSVSGVKMAFTRFMEKSEN